MNEVGANRYGKQAVRVVRVVRRPEHHELRDLTVGIALEGAFADGHVTGSNALVVATDTMKNTAYALAREHLTGAAEPYGIALATHFLRFDQVERVTVTIREHRWSRLAPDAFQRSADLTRTASIMATPDAVTVEAGVEDLVLLKTSRSAFSGFPRDEYTTLKETDDRLMATRLSATWRYRAGEVDWDRVHASAVETLLAIFADHHSLSVQQSVWLMGDAVLQRLPELESVTMALPNLHHWLVDLSPFGQPNDGEVYVATTEPHGLIEATVRRSDAVVPD